jgi:hypothetical protein
MDFIGMILKQWTAERDAQNFEKRQANQLAFFDRNTPV